jgi:hypothetical protein
LNLNSSSFLDTNINNPRKYGLWDKQSSNTFRQSTISYSFPQVVRFKTINVASVNVTNEFKMPFTKLFNTSRAASIGYGERSLFLIDKNSKNSPGPDSYNIGSLKSKIACTIKGKLDDIISKNRNKNPGPGQYSPLNKQSALPTSLKFRHGFFYDEELKSKKYQISPQKYNPSIAAVKQSRFSSIKFSKEERLSKDKNSSFQNPGPGYYNLPSVFDLKRKHKPSIN